MSFTRIQSVSKGPVPSRRYGHNPPAVSNDPVSLSAELASIRQLEGRDVIGGLRRLVAMAERGEDAQRLWRNRCFIQVARRWPRARGCARCARFALRAWEERWEWTLPQVASWVWYSLDLHLWVTCQDQVVAARTYGPVLVEQAVLDPKRFAAVLEVAITHPRHDVMDPLLRDVLAAFLQRLQEGNTWGRRDIPPFGSLKSLWVRMIHEALAPRLARLWEIDDQSQPLLAQVLMDFGVDLVVQNPEILGEPLPPATRLKLLDRARLPHSELMMMCHEQRPGGSLDGVRAGLMDLALGAGRGVYG